MQSTTNLLKLLSCHHEDATDKRFIMIQWVEFGGGYVHGTTSRIRVFQVIIHREEVNIMHDKIVTVVSSQHKPNIQEHGSVKSIDKGEEIWNKLIKSNYA